MADDHFVHPRRFPKNAAGPFYTLGHRCPQITSRDAPRLWCGDCLACEAPEAEAPDLLAPLSEHNIDTYFVRQPKTIDEIERACRAAKVCCVAALRYGGQDRAIIEQLNNSPDFCDYCIDATGSIWLTVKPSGDFSRAAKKLISKYIADYQRAERRANSRWWQFWIR
jgi:hypothetical protein